MPSHGIALCGARIESQVSMHGCRAITGTTAHMTTASRYADRFRNVGLFRYWTLSNVPLFLLAMPMLLILGASAFKFLPSSNMPFSATERKSPPVSERRGQAWLSPVGVDVARRFAVPQLVLALLAVMSYHVHIVTRISSGYPLWYWWLAS